MHLFRVPDMTCSGCVRAVASAVRDIDAAASFDANLDTKQVRVTSTAATDTLVAAVREAGFTVEAG